VEGDWPDCYNINRFVKGYSRTPDAEEALRTFRRWPTWMWANEVVHDRHTPPASEEKQGEERPPPPGTDVPGSPQRGRRTMLFRDRSDAGRQLASKLMRYANRDDVVVLALPRGGVPVGYEVAQALHAPLDVFVVRKLGVPGHEELAMGAIASGGVRILNESVLSQLPISEEEIEKASARADEELRRRELAYRDGRPPLDLEGKIVILVDDGLATGSTMRAAVEALRRTKPGWIVVAVPVGASESCGEFKQVADDAICTTTPEPFYAVGLWYDDFTQTSDEEVRQLLARGAMASGVA